MPLFLIVSVGVVFVFIALVKQEFFRLWLTFSKANNFHGQGISGDLRFLLDI